MNYVNYLFDTANNMPLFGCIYKLGKQYQQQKYAYDKKTIMKY